MASIFILLHKIQTTRSCRGKVSIPVHFVQSFYFLTGSSCTGISFKTQALYVGVFLTRYLDLFYHFVSVYNSVMKLFFIGSSCYILYLMKIRYRSAAGFTYLLHITPFHSDLNLHVSDQRMTLPSTPSRSNISSLPASSFPSSSTTSSP